ncbi:hypothetical protein, partial [Clostridium botulinum]|uniref:hypothetical protein n=1 Tax=Clostridium botulinum TaxID=1491 RepID=UPI0007748FA5
IKSVGELEGNKISILSHGKNLWKFGGERIAKQSNSTDGYFGSGETLNGILQIGKTYTFSCKVEKISGNLLGAIDLKYGSDYKEGANNSNSLSFTFTCNSKDKVWFLKFYSSYGQLNTNSEIRYYDIQLEEGTTVTSHEDYKADKTEILLTSPHMGLPSDVADVIDYDKNERTKNVAKLQLETITGWTVTATDVNTPNTIEFQYYYLDGVPDSSLICNNFNIYTADWLWNKDVEGIAYNKSKMIQLRINKAKLESLDDIGLKKWFQTNLTVLYHQLANPITEKLNIKDELQTFQDGYIQLDNAITPCTSLEYSTNIPSALGGLTKVVDHNVDEITNIESTISDMDAEIGEARKGKTTLEERLEEDRTNILSAIGNVNVETDGDISKQLKDINKNKAEGKVRLLNKDNISLLGLAFPCTCEQLAEAMKDGDILFMDSYILSDAPTNFGQLFVTRENSNRVSFQYRKVAESSNIT